MDVLSNKYYKITLNDSYSEIFRMPPYYSRYLDIKFMGKSIGYKINFPDSDFANFHISNIKLKE